MQRTVEFLESLPPYEEGQILTPSWEELCCEASSLARQDILELLKASQKTVGRKLLPDAVFGGRYFLQPYMHLGSAIVCPNDAYRKKTRQPSHAAIHNHPGPGIIQSGIEIQASLLRRVPVPDRGPDVVRLAYVALSLSLNHAHEIAAFRRIFDDYKAIVRKLLDMAPLEFFMSAVYPEVDKVRSKKALPRLDAALHLPTPDPDDFSFDPSFEITYDWYPNTDYDEGARAFRTLAILFTCIQKAAASSRSRGDDLLEFWNALEDRGKKYPKRRKWPGPALPDGMSPEEAAEDRIAAIQQEWKRKQSQLAGTLTEGPELRPNGRSGPAGHDLKHTGSSLLFAADNRRMAADILLLDRGWRRAIRSLYLHRDQVPFDLCIPGHLPSPVEQQGFIPLSHVLGVIYRTAAPRADVLELLNTIAPLLGEGDATALKLNCFDLLNTRLAALGYAVSVMSAARDYVRVRIVWVYAPCQAARPLKQYLPCATLRVNLSADAVPGTVQWMPRTEGDMSGALLDRLIQEAPHPDQILSSAGMQAAADCFAWKKGIRKSPRRRAHEERVSFVAQHPHLWDDHSRLASALIDAGLYSTSTIPSQIEYGCSQLIEEAQQAHEDTDSR